MTIRAAFLPAPALLPGRPLAQADSLAGQLPPDALAIAAPTMLILFLIAVLAESALAVLFDRRPFVGTFNARAAIVGNHIFAARQERIEVIGGGPQMPPGPVRTGKSRVRLRAPPRRAHRCRTSVRIAMR